MNPDELRTKIYEELGLEIGSLSSEGGNDWERAKKEVLSNYREEQRSKQKETNIINYAKIEKISDDFQFILNTEKLGFDNHKLTISSRNDLNDSDFEKLIATGSKEVVMNIVRTHQLSSMIIDKIIPNSIYLTKKYILEYQSLTSEQKNTLRAHMVKIPNLYSDLLELI